jgi:hypothetical protein
MKGKVSFFLIASGLIIFVAVWATKMSTSESTRLSKGSTLSEGSDRVDESSNERVSMGARKLVKE